MSEDPRGLRDIEAWRRAFDSARSTGGGECPHDDVLATLVTGETVSAERARLADHIVVCRRCADTYRALTDLHRAAGHGRLGGNARRLSWAIAAAASVTLAVWVAKPGSREAAPETEVVRAHAAVTRAEPAPGAQLEQPPGVLTWAAQPGATYRVKLFDAAAEPLWEQVSAEPRVVLPPGVRARLTAGAAYFWVVEIQATSGPDRLGPYWFSLRDRE